MIERPVRLFLRADASRAIGTGHAMRLIALGEAWVEQGGEATWLLTDAPASIVERARTSGISPERVTTTPGSPEDASTLRDRLGADVDAAAAVDGPTFDVDYLEALAPVADRVTVVDDMAQLARYPVGLVVNQNAHAERAAYPPDAADAGRPGDRATVYLLGLDHVLLRREFRIATPTPALPARARTVLIAFGGADPSGMSARAIGALAGLGDAAADLDVTVVVGPANLAVDSIERTAATVPFRLTIARDVADMAALMARMNLAIVSGGSSVWELARMGVPAIVVETAPPEADLSRGLAAVGLFDRLGPAASLDEATLASAVVARLDDLAWRAEMAERGRRLVDGHGTDRVAAAIRERLDRHEPGDSDARTTANGGVVTVGPRSIGSGR